MNNYQTRALALIIPPDRTNGGSRSWLVSLVNLICIEAPLERQLSIHKLNWHLIQYQARFMSLLITTKISKSIPYEA